MYKPPSGLETMNGSPRWKEPGREDEVPGGAPEDALLVVLLFQHSDLLFDLGSDPMFGQVNLAQVDSQHPGDFGCRPVL